MSRRLTRRQQQRIDRSQERRRELAGKKLQRLDEGGLGPEQVGLVLTHHGHTLIIEDNDGQLHRCAARQNLGRLACGDRVVWQLSSVGDGVVVAIGERRSLLTRLDYNSQPRPLAANLDTVAVVLAPAPEPSEYLIDRYLVAIAAAGAQGLLVLNKVDLLDPPALAALLARMEPYRRIGYPLLQASSYSAQGLAGLRDGLRGRVSLLVGQSGVGKSSLIKALLPDRDIRIQAVSAATGHGAHTTSASTLYHLPDGGDLIDTPGVRSFELGEISPNDLERGFPELAPYVNRCRFADCQHDVEPNCALREAVSKGVIAPRRLDSYRQLRAELAAATKPGRHAP
ncbi:MAG: small ribosomal subunit biogenesis GTPase RsgA [Candidatus Competibacteraceae bacterium]|nr:small ribosomal subunit biogenesis GTPase RsgA [Candidatus Competibacteraceae bacterium]MBK8899436.1 small ribosomal subunit biogenesis GTPase RsgA [Candidatus Competibacteraceae bacterium]